MYVSMRVCVCVCVFFWVLLFLSPVHHLCTSCSLCMKWFFCLSPALILQVFSPQMAFPLPFPDTKYVLCCSLHQTQSSPSWHICALVILYSLAYLFIWYLSSSLDGKWRFQRIFLEQMNDFPMISYWKSTLIFILSHLLKPRYNSLYLLQSA